MLSPDDAEPFVTSATSQKPHRCRLLVLTSGNAADPTARLVLCDAGVPVNPRGRRAFQVMIGSTVQISLQSSLP